MSTGNAGSPPYVRALTGPVTMSCVITGNEAVLFYGKNSGAPGIVTLNATNTYNGNTQVGSQTVAVGAGVSEAIPHGAGPRDQCGIYGVCGRWWLPAA